MSDDTKVTDRVASSLLASTLVHLAECSIREANVAADLRGAYRHMRHHLNDGREREFYDKFSDDCHDLIEANTQALLGMVRTLRAFGYPDLAEPLFKASAECWGRKDAGL
jgi:hypothetical protein